jgi:hypothetical protein
MAEIKTVNLEINSNLAQTEQAVVSLKTELRKAQQEVAAMSDKFGAASKEAIEAAKRAADLKDRIGDAKDLTDAFNPDAKFKALAGAANIAAGALAGFEGAMGLVGVQSEDAQKAILKVQSALAISQGLDVLQQIPDTFRNIKAVAINAFNGIKTAIGATGIGLLVVALGAVYANWDSLRKLIGDSVPALKEGTKSFDKLKEVFFGVGNAIVQYLITPFKAVLKLLKLDFKGAIQEIKNGADVIGNYEKGAAKERQDQADAYAKQRLEKQIKNKENEIAIAKASGKDTYDLEKQNLHRKLLLNKGNQEELDKLRQEERLLDATHKKALQDKQKTYNDELKKKREEAKEEAVKAKKEELEAIENARKELEDKFKEDAKAFFDKGKQSEEDAANLKLEQEKILQDGITEINKNSDETITENKKANADAQIAIAEAEAKAKIEALDAVSATLNSASDLLGKQTTAGKILAIASATISTFTSAQKAYEATVGIPIVGPALAPINAGLAIAAGFKNIQSIAKVKTPNGGGGASTPSSSSFGGSATQAPQFNVVGNSGVNQLAQTLGGQSEQAPIQAYVVAQNVTTAQGMNRSIVENASLG